VRDRPLVPPADKALDQRRSASGRSRPLQLSAQFVGDRHCTRRGIHHKDAVKKGASFCRAQTQEPLVPILVVLTCRLASRLLQRYLCCVNISQFTCAEVKRCAADRSDPGG